MAAGLAVVSILLALALVYWFLLRTRYRYWGATTAEISRLMLGDSEVAGATYETTLAVTVNASAAELWPWLLQLGYGRGGLYSYDWLDRLFGFLDAPSAERILPECQHLQVGDVIPIGRGAGFPVKALEPLRTLVLAGESDGFQWVWQLGLSPVDERRTRLISRNRARLPSTIRSALFMYALEPAAFIMTRKMLLGLKRRVESGAAPRAENEVRVA
jgi:hypothetical protein